ncbi:phage tail sheath family protein [Gimesia fumaroli]|uniref:Phage tail sheath protein n=1 Tax=Gimesia fumaroli TaxID=2527976 RepID=A0A518IA08_9PLAN|nr:phage tail sheath family protein [Gimesia fumaroli]QDV49890.1 Phage tail sheath protein [Gimesia fumaroli]
MPEYLHPGVYIEEVERGPRPVEGVPTSTAAILGETERGSITPRLVTSYKEYQRWFGRVFGADKYVPYATNGFFENGGKRAYICRIVGQAATTAEENFGDFNVRAAGPGEWGNRVTIKISDGSTKDSNNESIGFRLRVAYWDGSEPAPAIDPFDSEQLATTDRKITHIEDFDDLVTDETSPDFYGKRFPLIDDDISDKNQGPESSALAMLVRLSGVSAIARPENGVKNLTNGADDATPVANDDFKGLPAGERRIDQGLSALELDPYRDVALVYAPQVDPDTSKAIISHCEKMKFRFAVVDAPKGQNSASDLNPRNSVTDTTYAAFYYPWLVTSDPQTGVRKLTPPGGHVLGVYARSDTERGVFKAPANEIVRGAFSVEFDINDELQDVLNPKGVNVIRSLPGRGIRVWGARTLSSNALWKYVSVRRLFIFLERSIYENTQWVVFEPNDQTLWSRVTDTIRLFLRTQWRLGALFGATEEEAFFITCDETTMSQDDILNGRLICEIGIAPVRPAEFVIFRIFQHTNESQQ